MANSGLKRKTFEQDSSDASNPVQEHKRYTYLQNVTCSKLSVFKEKHSEDLRMQVLLNSADRYISESVAQLSNQESQQPARQLAFPNGIPSEETSWSPVPDSWNQEDSESLLEEIMELSPKVMGDSRTNTNITIEAASGSSSSCKGQVAGRSALPHDPWSDLCTPTVEGLLRDTGRSCDSDVAGPMLPDGGLPSFASDALATSPVEESSIWDALSQKELFCYSLSGSFEILADSYLQDLPLDDVFADIDISALHSSPAPSKEQSQPACTSQEVVGGPQPEAVHLPGQNVSTGTELEHFVELQF